MRNSIASIAAALLLAASFPAEVAAQQQFRWKLQSANPAGTRRR